MQQTQAPQPAPSHKRSVEGEWEKIHYRFNYLPVHVVLLRTGKVLAFGGTGNDEKAPSPHPAEIWDPQTGHVHSIDQELDGDVFCAGQAQLPDGRILVAGGTYKYDGKTLGLPIPPFSGSQKSFTFDPVEERWTRIEDMAHARWYPTLVGLGNGNVVTMAGLTKRFPWAILNAVELYDPGKGWSELKRAHRWLPLYPRLHLLPTGDIFYSGSYNTHYTFPFSLSAFPTSTLDMNTMSWRSMGMPRRSEREEGFSVLLPLEPPDYKARVLLAGGGTTGGKQATSAAEIIDLSEPNPKWKQISPMNFARYYAYATILPDKTVFVVGGREGTAEMNMGAGPAMPGTTGPIDPTGDLAHDPLAILDTERFDPRTETWTKMAPMTVDRLYHSNALLLPDGRVVTCGSNPARRVNELRIEIYRPPYYNGDRPVIEDCPSTIHYGSHFDIKVAPGETIESVALLRPGATTHCVNTDQRYVGLDFEMKTGHRISASVPSNWNVLPIGYYMMFIVTEKQIPSAGRFVQVT